MITNNHTLMGVPNMGTIMPNMGTNILRNTLASIPGRLLIAVIRVYQFAISPLLGPHCRFEPTCSVYFVESVRRYGVIRGAWRGVRRICRCHPWNPGGYDPP